MPEPGTALAFEPPHPVTLTAACDAVRWARTIPDFGSVPEVFAVFLGPQRRLVRAVWLAEVIGLDELHEWPDFVLGYAPPRGVTQVLLLVAQPGEGTEPTMADAETWQLMRLAHDAAGVPLADVVLVDGRGWHSLAETLA
jgi:hypothetical protein